MISLSRSGPDGAAAISPPYDLTVSGPALDSALGGFYVRRFLRKLIPKAIAKEKQYPGCLDVEAVRRSRTFAEFDTHATAALHDFRDAYDYWARVGCGQFLPGVRVPLLLVSAALAFAAMLLANLVQRRRPAS